MSRYEAIASKRNQIQVLDDVFMNTIEALDRQVEIMEQSLSNGF